MRRLREAGAIILGRTNLPLLAFDWQSRNPLFKVAKNPLILHGLRVALRVGLRRRCLRICASGFRLGSGRKLEYQHALTELEVIHSSTDRFFKEFDLWILPISPAKAIQRQRYGFPLSLNGRKISYSDYLVSYLVPTATMALQVHGARFSDFNLLRLAKHLEKHAKLPRPGGFEQ